MITLKRVHLEGYKSIERMDLELRPINVLIGANGAGKSNLLSFFKLIGEMVREKMQLFVRTSGGANSFLFQGAKRTPGIETSLEFEIEEGILKYHFQLVFSAEGSLVIKHEGLELPVATASGSIGFVASASDETVLPHLQGDFAHAGHAVSDLLQQCRVFQFNDTSLESRIRQSQYIHDNQWLSQDGGNLAPVLYRMKQTQSSAYDRVVRTVKQVLPWFGDFRLQPLELNPNHVQLDWQERDSEFLFGPHQLPDGALRAMALVTLLLQPAEYLPSIIVIDEPELGLHPHALAILAALVKGAAFHAQVVLATQSVALLEQFEPEDIVVVDRENGASTFTRLRPEELKDWLEDYSLGELWEKNVIGGGPV